VGATVTAKRVSNSLRRTVEVLDLPLLWIVFLGGLLRSFRLGKPDGALIFDEVYYVQDARVILGLPVRLHHLSARALSGLDPNSEHPPLAKLIMAASMWVFGHGDFAWRVPSVVLGTLSIWLIYKLVLAIGGTTSQARIAAFVLAFDNLAFLHGRIATLDIYVMTFMLLGTLLYVRRSFAYAGIALGLGTLCKLNGVFGVVAVALFGLFDLHHNRKERGVWRCIEPIAVMLVVYVAFTVCALGALDCAWTPFRSPLEHLTHIVRYGASLTRRSGSLGAESTPFQWWLNQAPIDYFSVYVTSGALTKTTVLFRGAMTEYVICAAPLALAYAALRAWRGSRYGGLVLCLFAANYVPVFLAWGLAGRMSYIYYFLQSLPAVALAIALTARAVPRVVRWAFVAAVLFSFATWFPFRWY
jgi:predicted membrane-bound dolichyl-phosphate-mannose-protein mannosyltransferase